MSEGIRIARRGKDVRSSQPRDLMFSSELINLPIHAQQGFTVDYPSGAGTSVSLLIPHDLGFPPLVRGWIQPIATGGASVEDAKISLPVIYKAFAYYFSSDKSNITVNVGSTGVGGPGFPTNSNKLKGYIYIFATRWQS